MTGLFLEHVGERVHQPLWLPEHCHIVGTFLFLGLPSRGMLKSYLGEYAGCLLQTPVSFYPPDTTGCKNSLLLGQAGFPCKGMGEVWLCKGALDVVHLH